MKKIDANTLINFDEELQAMLDYTLEIWDGRPEDLRTALQQGFIAGRQAAQFWLNELSPLLCDYSDQWTKSRESLGSKLDMRFYDDVHKIAENIFMNTTSYRDFITKDWDYFTQTNNLTNIIASVNVSFKDVLPKGWQDVVSSGKSVYEQFEVLNCDTDQNFKGHVFQSAGGPGFNEIINLAQTYYSHSEQKRSPLYTLVSSAFTHGLNVRQHNNAIGVLNEAKRLQEHFSQPEFNKPTFITDITKLSNNPIFNALMVSKYPSDSHRTYTSQEELDAHIKEANENNNIYGIVNWSMLGSDDYSHEGFKIQKIYTLEHFEKQIKDNVEKYFENEDYKEIYFSDNSFSTVSKEELLSSLSFKQVSQKEFTAIQNVLGSNNSNTSISFGDTKAFMNYKFPTQKDLIAMNAGRLKGLLNALNSQPNTETPVEKKEKDDREQVYHQTLSNILGMNNTKKKKP